MSLVFTFQSLLWITMLYMPSAHSEIIIRETTTHENSVNNIATFQCFHTFNNGLSTFWTLNNSSAEHSSSTRVINGATTLDNEGVVYSNLTIADAIMYNGSVIHCRVLLSNSTVILSQPLVLTATTVLPTTEAPPTTIPSSTISTTMATSFVTSMTESTTNSISFTQTPSPLNVSTEQQAIFYCDHQTADGIIWSLNDTTIKRLNFSGVSAHHSTGGPEEPDTLTVTVNTSRNEVLYVKCIATFLNDPPHRQVQTNSVLLLIQGPLQSPSQLSYSRSQSSSDSEVNVMCSWIPPPSLDLTNVDPDIIYCVEVYNITCGRRNLLISDCHVTETSYTSDVIDPGYIYEYVVTPRSNVEGARNGTSAMITDAFINMFVNGNAIEIKESRKASVTLNFKLNQAIGHIKPSSYTLSLDPLDGLDGLTIPLSVIEDNGSVLVLESSELLPIRRIWNCTIIAHNCHQHILSNTTPLSTHDLQNILVTSPSPGELRVSGDFIDGSTATGALSVALDINNDNNVHYGFMQRSAHSVSTNISGLPAANYAVSVFVVEENGNPLSTVATLPVYQSVDEGLSSDQVCLIDFDLQPTPTGVCVTCTFLDSSTSECVAVVHQRISQLNSSGLMNIESSHKFTRSGDTASGCIEGVDLTHYQVGVIGGKRLSLLNNARDGSSVAGSVVGIVLGLLMFIVLIMIMVLVVIVVVRRRHVKAHADVSVESDTLQRDSEPTVNANIYEVAAVQNQTQHDTSPLLVRADNEPSSSTDEQYEDSEASTQSSSGPEDISPLYDTASQAMRQTCSSQPPPSEASSTKDSNSTDPIYTQPQLNRGGVPPPSGVGEVTYHQVTGYKNDTGQQYAIPVLGKPGKKPDDFTRTESEYSEILQKKANEDDQSVQSEDVNTRPGENSQQNMLSADDTEVSQPPTEQVVINLEAQDNEVHVHLRESSSLPYYPASDQRDVLEIDEGISKEAKPIDVSTPKASRQTERIDPSKDYSTSSGFDSGLGYSEEMSRVSEVQGDGSVMAVKDDPGGTAKVEDLDTISENAQLGNETQPCVLPPPPPPYNPNAMDQEACAPGVSESTTTEEPNALPVQHVSTESVSIDMEQLTLQTDEERGQQCVQQETNMAHLDKISMPGHTLYSIACEESGDSEVHLDATPQLRTSESIIPSSTSASCDVQAYAEISDINGFKGTAQHNDSELVKSCSSTVDGNSTKDDECTYTSEQESHDSPDNDEMVSSSKSSLKTTFVARSTSLLHESFDKNQRKGCVNVIVMHISCPLFFEQCVISSYTCANMVPQRKRWTQTNMIVQNSQKLHKYPETYTLPPSFELTTYMLETMQTKVVVVAEKEEKYISICHNSTAEFSSWGEDGLVMLEVGVFHDSVTTHATLQPGDGGVEQYGCGVVAVVHQRISKLNSSGLMNIESSNKFTRSDDTASGCIEGVDLTHYQVGVVGVFSEPKGVQKGISKFAGSIFGIGLVFFIMLVLLLLFVLRRQVKKHFGIASRATKTSSSLPPPSEASSTRGSNSTDPIYTQSQLKRGGVPPPSGVGEVTNMYNEVKNDKGQEYVILEMRSPGKKPDDLTLTEREEKMDESEYVETKSVHSTTSEPPHHIELCLQPPQPLPYIMYLSKQPGLQLLRKAHCFPQMNQIHYAISSQSSAKLFTVKLSPMNIFIDNMHIICNIGVDKMDKGHEQNESTEQRQQFCDHERDSFNVKLSDNV